MNEPDQIDQMSEEEVREELRKVLTVCIPMLKWKRSLLIEALEVADEALALIEDTGHGVHMDNISSARGVIATILTK
jgi:hypothetical protein